MDVVWTRCGHGVDRPKWVFLNNSWSRILAKYGFDLVRSDRGLGKEGKS